MAVVRSTELSELRAACSGYQHGTLFKDVCRWPRFRYGTFGVVHDSSACCVDSSVVDYRPDSRLMVVLDGCVGAATTARLSTTAGSAALVVGTCLRAVTSRTASRCWAVVRESPSRARAVASSAIELGRNRLGWSRLCESVGRKLRDEEQS